jgi:hypothetical protein
VAVKAPRLLLLLLLLLPLLLPLVDDGRLGGALKGRASSSLGREGKLMNGSVAAEATATVTDLEDVDVVEVVDDGGAAEVEEDEEAEEDDSERDHSVEDWELTEAA